MTPNDVAGLISRLDDRQTVALTLYGECDGEGPEGQVAVVWVLRNRAARGLGGTTLKAVCLAPKQFTCWYPQSTHEHANTRRMLALAERLVAPAAGPVIPIALAQIWAIVGKVLGNEIPDPTKHADHYLTRHAYSLLLLNPDHWVHRCEVTVTIGQHVFLRERKKTVVVPPAEAHP